MFRRLLCAATATVVAAGVLVLGLAAPAQAASATLSPNQSFGVGSSLVSPAGGYTLVLQSDGNLVLYVTGGKALWSTRTNGTNATELVLQTDGNLVLYPPAGPALWNSGTNGKPATSLALQDDGDLVLSSASGTTLWASHTTQQAPPKSIGDHLPQNSSLTAATVLTSASGVYTLKLVDGALVLAQGSTTLWTTFTTGSGATKLKFQSDGNVVLYNGTTAWWNTHTWGTTADQFVLQDDGNLVLYQGTTALWSSNTSTATSPIAGTDRLLPGQTMRAGATLTAPGGQFETVLQGDGNLVVYGPSGATWSTRSNGWPGVTATLQSDGNFVVYSAQGTALFWTGTSGGTFLAMQADGNLVLYGAAGALWSIFTSPPPPVLFPPVTAPPPTATSHYFRNLYGTAADLTTTWSLGCTDGRANPANSKYIVFLAYGAQASSVNGTWGVQLTASTLRITDAAVIASANSYIDGYTACMATNSWVTISIGTNNDGEDAGLAAVGGQIWGSQIVNPIAVHAAGRPVTVAGANDIEPGFAGSPDQARAWMSGYLGSTSAPFVWTGSADGCPQSGPSNAACNYGWTPRTLFDLAYGASAGRSLPLPQIYYTSQAKQWVNISQIGQVQWGQHAIYAGPLTEVTACAQANSCYSMGAVDAWNTFWNLLSANPTTRQTELGYTTDLRIDS